MTRGPEPSVEDGQHAGIPAASAPDVSVVIVSWNVAALLADCLDSLVRCSDGLSLEVWVVDNASSDNSVEMVRSRYPWVHLIANTDNRGFARANNQAFRQARGRFVLILNPDTVVHEGAIGNLHRFLLEHGDVGAVGPRLLESDGSVSVTSGRRVYDLGAAFCVECLKIRFVPWIGPWVYHRVWSPYDLAVTQEVECLSGAAMFVRREVLEDLQGFGETFVHCGEDLDFCFRARVAGWKLYYCTDATIVHFINQSSTQAELRCRIEALLSTEEYFVRCRGRFQGWLYRAINQWVTMPRSVIVAVSKYLAGVESRAEFRERLEFIRFLLTWKRPQ